MKSPSKKRGLIDRLFELEPEKPAVENKSQGPKLQPALRQIGTTDCPVCKHEVAVFLTKNTRPFINCGFCGARIFFNGLESMRRLKRAMEPVDGGVTI
jgi:transcription elongation factor Elf1